MTPAAKLVNEVVKTAVSPLLRAAGFKAKGHTFYRVLEDQTGLVNVQSSIRNVADCASFTINLGVYFPAVASLVERESEKDLPVWRECSVQERIGKLLPKGLDHWWEVSRRADVKPVSSEVSDALTAVGLPWLERMGDLRHARDFTRGSSLQDAAAMSLLLGEREEARRLVREIIDRLPSPSPVYDDRMLAWAAKVGLRSSRSAASRKRKGDRPG